MFPVPIKPFKAVDKFYATNRRDSKKYKTYCYVQRINIDKRSEYDTHTKNF